MVLDVVSLLVPAGTTGVVGFGGVFDLVSTFGLTCFSCLAGLSLFGGFGVEGVCFEGETVSLLAGNESSLSFFDGEELLDFNTLSVSPTSSLSGESEYEIPLRGLLLAGDCFSIFLPGLGFSLLSNLVVTFFSTLIPLAFFLGDLLARGLLVSWSVTESVKSSSSSLSCDLFVGVASAGFEGDFFTGTFSIIRWSFLAGT